MGTVVARKMATLRELETYYSYRDALNMAEVITVMNYNEWVAIDAHNKR